MSETIRWWLVLQLVGIVLLPLCLALFRRLPDRGYALSKPFGLIMLGFTFWILNSFHVLPNSRGGIIAALFLLAGFSAFFVYRERDDLIAWARANWRYGLGVEMLFLIVLAAAVYLRSLVGDIAGTEQPMDLMFLNATTHAEYFPPKDPWLAGHDVAYYYFGYLLVAMVGKLAGVAPEIGYNIGLAMTAAMAFVGAAGIVYNLVLMREEALPAGAPAPPGPKREPKPSTQNNNRRRRRAVSADEQGAVTIPDRHPVAITVNWRPPVFALVGGCMLVLMGNLAWVFQFMSAYDIGGKGFYEWIDIQGLTPGEVRDSWYPSDFFGFFNASRIYPLNASDRVITEFPMFSFLLGDLHPHVMALPFVVVIIGLALTLYRSREPLDITFWLQRPLALIAAAILLGGLTFINTWDIVAMSFIMVATVFASNLGRVRALTADLFVQVATFAIPLLILAFAFYSPFLVSISGNSQADGLFSIVTNREVVHPGTRPLHLLIFWGPLFATIIPFVIARILPLRARVTVPMVAISLTPLMAVPAGWVLLFLFEKATDSKHLGANTGSLFHQITDRGIGWVTAIALGTLLAAAIVAAWLEITEDTDRPEREGVIFTLALAVTGLMLILGTEFFYVGDVFNNRMNTVFKLYYEAWLLLAVAGAFSLYYLTTTWRSPFAGAFGFRIGWGLLTALTLAGAALYPLGGGFNRTHNTNGKLNGLANIPQDDYKGIQYLSNLADGQQYVIAEAWGNDYSEAARISSATGLPTILGWVGHENQWRSGSCKPCAGRIEDVKSLYQTTDPAEMKQILKKYNVSYVYVGDIEKKLYGENGLPKFQSLPVVFQSGAVTIYRASGVTGEVPAQ